MTHSQIPLPRDTPVYKQLFLTSDPRSELGDLLGANWWWSMLISEQATNGDHKNGNLSLLVTHIAGCRANREAPQCTHSTGPIVARLIVAGCVANWPAAWRQLTR